MHQLAVLSRQVEDSLQRRQFAVDLAVGIPPLLAAVVVANDHHVLLALQDERVHVGGADRREPSTAEVGQQVQPNPSLELIGRSASIDGVLGLEVLRRFIKPNAIELRVHR